MSNFEQQSFPPKNRHKSRSGKKFWLQSSLILLLLILPWSLVMGWGMAKAMASGSLSNSNSRVTHLAQGDSIESFSQRYQLAQEVYLENCSTCHIPIPPGVLPTETWQEILEKPEKHYGEQLPNIVSVSIVLIWEYMQTFSRPLNPGEVKPTFVEQSRYFKALHPRVDLPESVTTQSCVVCHPGAAKLDYRSLTPEWEDET